MYIVLQVQNIIIIPVKPPKTNILAAKTTAEWLYLGAGGLPVVTTLLNMNAESRISVFVDGTVIITAGVFNLWD
jgi:drug/metabolite transporter (DMT)-like permease